jgi:plastocyanin
MRWTLVFVLIMVCPGAGGCSVWGMEGGPGGVGAAVAATSSSADPVDAVAGPDGVQRITVALGDDLRMHPSVVRVHLGMVAITFRNAGAVPHEIRLVVGRGGDQCGAGSPCTSTVDSGNLDAGTSGVVRVSVDRPGVYPFMCIYHQSSGMTGSLVVVA